MTDQATAPSSLWMAEVNFGQTEARAFAETPAAALAGLIESWREACADWKRGDPSYIAEYRDSISLVNCESGRGYVKGVTDHRWHDKAEDALSPEFDALFEDPAAVPGI